MVGTPNADQVNAEEQFVDFLLSDEKEMKLIGPGGTGKSWTVQRLITNAMVIYQENCRALGLEPEYDKYALTALSNRAAQELSDQTGLEVNTIHSFLSLTVKPNLQTGKQDLKRTVSWTIMEKYIIFVDEAFMMDGKLINELDSATIKCKIVYIGDDCQLSPVEGGRSPVELMNIRTAELTIPVRNADKPDLQALCSAFRQNVKDVEKASELGVDHQWPSIPHVPGVIDWMDQNELADFLAGPMLLPDGGKLIVAFSNQRVNDYNGHMRGLRGQNHLFQVGEVLIANEMFQRGKFRIKNEATVQIVEARDEISWLQVAGLDVPTQYVKILGHPDQEIPVVLDRDFMKDAMKWAAKEARAGRQDWQSFYQLKESFADLRPRDASTTHKAQGSSKDLVIVDLTNIGSCNIPTMVARLLYVAFSRARHRIILFGQLPRKYGGP